MKAIILAAGKGTRLEPITLQTPKAMVKVYGKPLLAHNMDKLLPYVEQFIIVVRYKQEIIREYFWSEYKWIPVQYHEQGDKKGTWGALIGIEMVNSDCYILASDTIFHQKDIDKLAMSKWYGVLGQRVENPEKYGIFFTDENSVLKKVVEKPKEYTWNLASLFYFKLSSEIIQMCNSITPSPRGEYELTDALNTFSEKNKVQVLEIEHDFIDITSVKDLELANILTKPPLWITHYLENIWEYEVRLWIPQDGIQELINYTFDDSDTALRTSTGDYKNGKGRFTSHERINTWYDDEDRFPFTLLAPNQQLVGIWWWRPAEAPDIIEIINEEAYKILWENANNTHTSGIRIYPPARGKWLAGSFLDVCSRSYNCIFPEYCMCIDIDTDNIASQKATEKIGFISVWYGQNKNNSRKNWQDVWKERIVYIQQYNS